MDNRIRACNAQKSCDSKNDKSAQRRRKHCALAVVRRSQKFSHKPQTRFLGAQDGQNLISCIDGHYLYLQTQFG